MKVSYFGCAWLQSSKQTKDLLRQLVQIAIVVIRRCRSVRYGSVPPEAPIKMFSSNSRRQHNARRHHAAMCLLVISLQMFLSCLLPALAQTIPAPGNNNEHKGSQQPQGKARQTESTVGNPYADAIGQVGEVDSSSNVNTSYIGPAVDKILIGERTNIVFQAAEQGRDGDIRRIANNALNASLGSVNETYKGLHQWFADDIVGRLFRYIGQLVGKWMSEIINGWIADTVQFLAQFLRVFVLNPNIAVNGLDGKGDDGISYWVRQGADVMYGIAVDLLLLMFILCIWKYWAEASWRGAGNLMAPIGRLIFTAGMLLAWPTIYAFEVQISNEMIKAVFFAESNQQIAMLHYALATAVKGGVIAGGAAASMVFTPILGGAAFGATGPLVGSVFNFASLIIYLLLGGVLIAELVYILVLKAIQTALMTAQYMFAPIFLVFFATPDTESTASGFMRAFVETSLWTFGWVGLLKIMVIILFSDFNPWGKILIVVGVLQLMIQVPTFLARAQISPVSDFISAGLVTGGILKTAGALGGLLTGGINTMIGRAIATKQSEDLYGSKDAAVSGIGGPAGDQKQLEALNSASEKARNFDWNKHKPQPKPDGTVSPPVKRTADEKPGENGTKAAGAMPVVGPAGGETLTAPPSKKDKPDDAPGAAPTGAATGGSATNTAGAGARATTSTQVRPAAKPLTTSGDKPKAVTDDGTQAPNRANNDDQYKFGTPTPGDWDQSGLIHVDARRTMAAVTSVEKGLRHNQDKTSVMGSTRNGVERINIARGADGAEMTKGIYTAAFADNIAHDDVAKDAARQSASAQKAWRPQGFKQGLIANWMEANGQSWFNSPWAKENFNQAMFQAAVDGSSAYVNMQEGNAYTGYLRNRYGDGSGDRGWNEKTMAMATHLVTNPESSESPWNRNIGPAGDSLARLGMPFCPQNRGAIQNMSIQGMHPARQKKASLAVLNYTQPVADELFKGQSDEAKALGHGELARSLPAAQVAEAVAIYESSGSMDDVKPHLGSYVSSLAGATRQDLGTSYQALAMNAPRVARSIGRINPNINSSSISTLADLEANLIVNQGETKAEALSCVMETTSSWLSSGEMHGAPMRVVANRDIGRGVIDFMGADIGNMNSNESHRKMRVVAQNLRTVGTPNDTETYAAIDAVLLNGGSMPQGADEINLARQLVAQDCPPASLPGAISMAMRGGYHMHSGPLPVEMLVEAAALEAGGQRLNQQRIRMVGRLQEGGIGRDLMPQALEVAVRGNYGSMDSLPISEIKSIAEQYSMGVVSDMRMVPAMGAMVRAGEGNRISNQNLRIVAEAQADLGGYKNENAGYIKAVLRVAGGLQNPNLAPQVLETYVRANAEQQKLSGAEHLPLQELLAGMGDKFDIGSSAARISSFTRDGAFSPAQLQDPAVMNLVVQHAADGPQSLQAVHLVTRLVGGNEAAQHPEYIVEAKKFLGAGGKMRDFNRQVLKDAGLMT